MAQDTLSLYIFIVVAVIIAALFIFFTYLLFFQEVNQQGTVFPPPPCSSFTSNLPNVSSIPCCYVNGNNTTLKYSRDLNMVLAPSPTFYLSVCIGFCPSGAFNRETSQCDTSDPQAKAAFDSCVSILAPDQCQGEAMPVAIDNSNGTLYYAFQATSASCTLCCNCGIEGCIPSIC